MTKVRPLVNAAPVDEFGAITESDGFADPSTVAADFTYVPGWSEMRRDRDLAYAEWVNGRRLSEDVPTLPVNLRWGRRTVAGKAEMPDSAKLQSHANTGYVAVRATEAGKHPWLKGMPPGARIGPDGEIVNAAGDMQLLVISADGARRNRQRKTAAANAMQETSVEGSAELRHLGREHPGTDPHLLQQRKGSKRKE